MYQEEILNLIRTCLAILEAEVKMDNHNGEFSINVHAENVLLKVLNAAFGLDLYNVNYEENKKNYPAIDLRDDVKKVIFQITSTGTVEKVVHTLNQCSKHGFDNSDNPIRETPSVTSKLKNTIETDYYNADDDPIKNL